MKQRPISHRYVSVALLVIALARCLEATYCSAEDSDKVGKVTVTRTEEQVTNRPPSISLAPAVIMVKAKAGQTFSQELTLWNNTTQELSFRMEARDVVVREGKRAFVPAGELTGSIARNAVFSDKDPVAPPGGFAKSRVTVTVPDSPGPRAIVCIFMGKTVMGTHRAVAMTGSLGTLVTFNVADDFHVRSQSIQIVVDTNAQSITFRQLLTNVGSDPVVPKGVIAIMNEAGGLVTRLPLSAQRLLPGESLEFTAEHAGLLKTGKYQVISLDNENAFFSNSAEFTIK